ncbi:MAG: type II toxin-antitoxin system VapC family toxin [Candidatus Woesearchaeota archaeon]|nr:type II toxin-antitoxin system VapC family toxin [Candidatus Woesearchaeota archaeon]
MNCLDTSALMEIHNGGIHAKRLLEDNSVIPDLILAEFYGLLYRLHGQQTAEYWIRKLSPFAVHVSRETLFKAVKYRIDRKKEKLSFFDAVGYMYAQEFKLLFVTCDNDFKGKKGVLLIPSSSRT